MSAMRLMVGVCLVAAQFAAWGAGNEALPARLHKQAGDYSIEYSSGDERYVDALALQLQSTQWQTTSMPVVEFGLGQLESQQAQIERAIADLLALPQPTEDMRKTYAQLVQAFQTMRPRVFNSYPKKFSLWRKPELLARLEAGEAIPGFSRDEQGELNFSLSVSLFGGEDTTPDQIQARLERDWNDAVWPMKIGADPAATPAEDIASNMQQLHEGLAALRQELLSEQKMVAIVLHETTEVGIVGHYLRSRDRRWFCDGLANYVVYDIAARRLGADQARTYYDIDAEVAKYRAFAAQIDLERWPVAEDPDFARYPVQLSAANYGYAAAVIAKVTARYGDALLPRLFEKIGRTPLEQASMGTVYDAFHGLTGEDLRAYLPAANR